MPSCEKCWERSAGDVERYRDLLKTEKCNPEEQAGRYATGCPKCGRRAVHQYARICMACGLDLLASSSPLPAASHTHSEDCPGEDHATLPGAKG